MRTAKKRYIIFVFTLIFSFLLIHIVQAVTTDPGSEQDPLVTKSYVDSKISEILESISKAGTSTTTSTRTNANTTTTVVDDQKVQKLTEKVNELTTLLLTMNQKIVELEKGTKNDEGFKVVEVEAGKKLYAGAGAEIIVRAGTATGLVGEFGGLANVTSGKDVESGAEVPLNSLLISARNDYRGIEATTKVWIMIRGSYTIK